LLYQTTVCAVPLSNTIVTGPADGDSRSDTDHSPSEWNLITNRTKEGKSYEREQ
jgi:hypothetical protein